MAQELVRQMINIILRIKVGVYNIEVRSNCICFRIYFIGSNFEDFSFLSFYCQKIFSLNLLSIIILIYFLTKKRLKDD